MVWIWITGLVVIVWGALKSDGTQKEGKPPDRKGKKDKEQKEYLDNLYKGVDKKKG